ncbi:MAG: hypothetical protein GY941_10755 [Planctomycetes bacterium]|nr:hypothetical protein [Planctomycetota bacterium]
MLQKKTLFFIFMYIALQSTVYGSNKGSMPILKKSPEEHAKIAKNSWTIHSANLNYNRAQYAQVKKIILNNETILNKLGILLDISRHVKASKEIIEGGEEGSRSSLINHTNREYNKALYLLNKVILRQQEALLKFNGIQSAITPLDPLLVPLD